MHLQKAAEMLLRHKMKERGGGKRTVQSSFTRVDKTQPLRDADTTDSAAAAHTKTEAQTLDVLSDVRKEVPAPSLLAKDEKPKLFGLLDTKEEKAKEKSAAEVYGELSEYFGDTLTTRLPVIAACAAARSPPKLLSLVGEVEKRSGEELLREIEQQPEAEEHSISYESPESYEDEDNAAMDLTVKTMVSDPNLGIKVTISRRPKSKAADTKRRKHHHHHQLAEPVFERVPLRSGDIVFSYAGAVQKPRHLLRRRLPSDLHRHLQSSRVQSLALRCPLLARRRNKMDASTTDRRRLVTGNLEALL